MSGVCPADVTLTFAPYYRNYNLSGFVLGGNDWSTVVTRTTLLWWRTPTGTPFNLGLTTTPTYWSVQKFAAANATYQWVSDDYSGLPFWTILLFLFSVYFLLVVWLTVEGRQSLPCFTRKDGTNPLCAGPSSASIASSRWLLNSKRNLGDGDLCMPGSRQPATHGSKRSGVRSTCGEHAVLKGHERLNASLSETIAESASKVLDVCKLVSVLYIFLSAQNLTSMVCDTPVVLLGNGDPTQAQPGWGVISAMPSWLSNVKINADHILNLKYTLAQYHAVVALYSATPSYLFFYSLYAVELIGLAVIVCTWSAVEKQHWAPLYGVVSIMLAIAWGLYGTQAMMKITLLDGVGPGCVPDIIYCNVPYLPLITRSFTSLHLMIAGFYLGLMVAHFIGSAGFVADKWCCKRKESGKGYCAKMGAFPWCCVRETEGGETRFQPGKGGCCTRAVVGTVPISSVSPVSVVTLQEPNLDRRKWKAAQDRVLAAAELLRLEAEKLKYVEEELRAMES